MPHLNPLSLKNLIVCLLLLGLAGCVNFEPVEETTRYYLFGEANPSIAYDEDGSVVAISRLQLSRYLDRSELVVRKGEHEVVYATRHRWAEDLRDSLVRTIAEGITSRKPVASIGLLEQSLPEGAYLLNIRILRMEGLDSGEAILTASWRVEQTGEEQPVVSEGLQSWSTAWTPGDYRSLVEAHQKNLNTLIDILADSLNSKSGS